MYVPTNQVWRIVITQYWRHGDASACVICMWHISQRFCTSFASSSPDNDVYDDTVYDIHICQQQKADLQRISCNDNLFCISAC